MGILVVAVLATLLGFALILLIGRGQPVSPAARETLGRGDSTDTAWVRRYGSEGLQRLLVTLFTEMGFHPERCERGTASVDLFANDPTPIKGGRIYVHGVLGAEGPVEGDEGRHLIDTPPAADEAADDRGPGEVDRAGPLHRAFEGVLPGDRRARGPREGCERRSSALPRAQVDLGPEQPMTDDVDGPRIAVRLEQRPVPAED